MNISYEGIGYLAITMRAGTGKVGWPCQFDASGRAMQCANGNNICGVVEAVGDGVTAVQVEGFVKLPYTGTAPALGYTKLVGNGSSGVMRADDGMQHLVVSVDEAAGKIIVEL